MTYLEFRDKYNEKFIDYDGEFGFQCWDLAQQYVTECLGVPEWVLSGCGVAKNLLYGDKRNDLETYFYEVDVHEMNQGDLCIWDDGGAYGHIAIEDSWDGNNVWYFSQNPNPCRVMTINMGGLHAFRLRNQEPTPPKEVTPPVEPDKYKNQVEIKEGVTELRVRAIPSINGEIIGKVQEGKYYNYYEMTSADDYTWIKIADNQWMVYSDEWEILHLAEKKEEFIQLKVLEKKDGYVLVDLGKVWIKEN